jgi:hypothetical protein
VARNSGTTDAANSGVTQIIETNNLYDLQGQTVTLSFSARRGANFSAASNALTVVVSSGTVADQGSATYWSPGWTGFTSPISTTVALGTTEQTFSIQATIPANCLEIAVAFQYLSTGTAGAADYFEITNIQLERGSNSTSFEYRDFGRELIMCQRYFAKTFPQAVTVAQNSGNFGALYGLGQVNGVAFNVIWKYPVTMRTSPNITTYSPNAATANWSANPSSPTATVPVASEDFAGISANTATLAGNGYYIHASASAEL